MKTEIVVRVVDCHIFRWDNGEPVFLLLKRSENQMYPGIWQCVTGKIEKNEGVDLMMWNQQKQGLINFHQMLTKEPGKLKLSIIFNKK